MKKYLDTIRSIFIHGEWQTNRTGIRTKAIYGALLTHDMSEGFPLLTTKTVNWRSAFAETLGFIKGYDNAEQFRSLGTKVWDANANETHSWLSSPHRKGQDDLGLIYGSQSRNWDGKYDQLKYVVDHLLARNDNRRLIINHWNVADVMENRMCLPACHYTMQFGIRNGDTLDLMVNFRSHDYFLGAPFNLAGYGLMLAVLAHITGLTPGRLMMVGFNVHLYENHIEQAKTQLEREPRALPQLVISERVTDLDYLTNHATLDDFEIVGYDPHPAIKADMAA